MKWNNEYPTTATETDASGQNPVPIDSNQLSTQADALKLLQVLQGPYQKQYPGIPIALYDASAGALADIAPIQLNGAVNPSGVPVSNYYIVIGTVKNGLNVGWQAPASPGSQAVEMMQGLTLNVGMLLSSYYAYGVGVPVSLILGQATSEAPTQPQILSPIFVPLAVTNPAAVPPGSPSPNLASMEAQMNLMQLQVNALTDALASQASAAAKKAA